MSSDVHLIILTEKFPDRSASFQPNNQMRLEMSEIPAKWEFFYLVMKIQSNPF